MPEGFAGDRDLSLLIVPRVGMVEVRADLWAPVQLPGHRVGTRPGRKVLIRTDGAGATHAFLDYLRAQRLAYSVGFTLPENTPDLLALIPKGVWTEAYDAHDAVRDGARVAELTGRWT